MPAPVMSSGPAPPLSLVRRGGPSFRDWGTGWLLLFLRVCLSGKTSVSFLFPVILKGALPHGNSPPPLSAIQTRTKLWRVFLFPSFFFLGAPPLSSPFCLQISIVEGMKQFFFFFLIYQYGPPSFFPFLSKKESKRNKGGKCVSSSFFFFPKPDYSSCGSLQKSSPHPGLTFSLFFWDLAR